MKKIFYNKEQLLEYSNIEIVRHSLKKENTVLNFRETDREKIGRLTGQYCHLLKDDKVRVYYEVHEPESVCYAESDDGGITFKKSMDNPVLEHSLACHNFSAFIDTNPNAKIKFKAIGGYHVGKDYSSHKSCRCNNMGIELKNCLEPCWPKIPRQIFVDNINHPCQGNGYYIWESEDGINWKILYDKPVLSSFTKVKGYNDVGYMSFDNIPTIFYDDNINEYILYSRNNVKLGVRHVLYTKSKDLINWDEPKDINIDPEFDYNHDNLYYPGIYKYPGTDDYISFTPYFKNIIHDDKGEHRTYYDECTMIMYSKDRENWKIEDRILKSDNPEWKGHMKHPHISGFIESPDKKEFYLYAHWDFTTDHNTLIRYSIRKDGFSSIQAGEKEGYFILDKKLNSSKIVLNCLVKENGFIDIDYLDDKFQVIGNRYINSGDYLDKEIICDFVKDFYLKIKLKNANIFSIKFE